MSSSSEGETKESSVEEKETTATTTKPEEPKRRVSRKGRVVGERKEEQTMEGTKEKPTTTVPTAAITTIPKRLLNRIDKHDTYLATIQRDVRLLNRELKKLTTRVNRVEARLATKAKTKKGVGSSSRSNSSKKKKGRSKQ